jgi:hypothetical protein
MLRRMAWVLAFVVAGLAMAGKTNASGNTSIVKGTLYRGDKSHPVSGATITLLDERKSQNSDHSVDTKADENGRYQFPSVAEGHYTVSIRTWYDRQEDVPCQLLMAKTKDKNSTVMVVHDHGRYEEQVFIKGFPVRAGKDIEKDFDIACSSMFG